MITIGVTGGVGAGKSEILRYLENRYNCRVLLSDDAAKELELKGRALYEPLVRLLSGSGPEKEQAMSDLPSEERESEGMPHEALLLENGEINKAEMARRIFADEKLLQKVN